MPKLAAVVFLVALAAPLGAQGISVPVPLAELQQRVRADSNDPAAHYNVALGYWNAKKWPEATRELNAAIGLEPRFATAHLALAYLAFARDPDMLRGLSRIDKDTPKPIRDAYETRSREFARAFTIDPMVDMRIIAAGTRSINLNNPVYEAYFGRGFTALMQGYTDCYEGHYSDCESNIAVYMRMVDIKDELPTSALWYHGLASAHLQHYDAAIEDFSRLLKRDSASLAKAAEKDVIRIPIRTSQYRYFIGTFQQAEGHDDDAIASYHEALERDLSIFVAHVRLADIYQARKDYDHAIAERHNAVNADPDDASLQIDLGVTLGLAGQFAEAHDVLHGATEALPRDADAWYWYGIASEQVGRKDDARHAFQQVIAVAPTRLQARVAQAKQHLAKLP